MTTKLHALVLDDRVPLILTLTPGHWGDAPWGRWLLEQLGPPLGQPQLLADRAYEGDEMRTLAARLGWELVTPPRSTRLQPWPLNREADRARNPIERYFGRLKRMRGIATRYHQLARSYLNQILLACIHFMTKQSEQALVKCPWRRVVKRLWLSTGALAQLLSRTDSDTRSSVRRGCLDRRAAGLDQALRRYASWSRGRR